MTVTQRMFQMVWLLISLLVSIQAAHNNHYVIYSAEDYGECRSPDYQQHFHLWQTDQSLCVTYDTVAYTLVE